jgi:NAD(P)-dependent dehydrogenase (short-subunit alcohol dehydrogenase family)
VRDGVLPVDRVDCRTAARPHRKGAPRRLRLVKLCLCLLALSCARCASPDALSRRCASPAAQTALVTGGNTGIGFEVASALAAHGATVLLASRSKERVDAAVKKIKAAHPSATVVGYALDLSQFRRAAGPCALRCQGELPRHYSVAALSASQTRRGRTWAVHVLRLRGARARSSIDAFVDQLAVAGVSALHILINNAGVLNPPFAKARILQSCCERAGCIARRLHRVALRWPAHACTDVACLICLPFLRIQTEQGFEVTMGTNAVGTIYLTQRLLPLLEAGAPSRVVVLSSELASISPALDLGDLGGEALKSTTLAQYNASKLCNALYALELSRLYGSRGVLAASTHPGIVATTLVGKADSGCFESGFLSCGLLFACTPAEGAISTLYAATVPGLKGA